MNSSSGGVIISKCGNGLLQSGEDCDDLNLQSWDGCSASCKIESSHSCNNEHSVVNYSLCYYSDSITLTPNLIYKYPGENSAKL